MPTVYVYNPVTKLNEKYIRNLWEPMPYVLDKTMTVGEFRANSSTSILWTDKRVIDSWNKFRAGWGRPIFVGYAFKRIWEGGHSGQSQHYVGAAFDLGHTLTSAEREALRKYAVDSGYWSYVEPANLTPRWVHVDDRFGSSACSSGGYPPLGVGSRGIYVFTLQDALMALGITGSGLDGYYGYGTKAAVSRYQTQNGLSVTGSVNCSTWVSIAGKASGIGATSTVIR